MLTHLILLFQVGWCRQPLELTGSALIPIEHFYLLPAVFHGEQLDHPDSFESQVRLLEQFFILLIKLLLHAVQVLETQRQSFHVFGCSHYCELPQQQIFVLDELVQFEVFRGGASHYIDNSKVVPHIHFHIWNIVKKWYDIAAFAPDHKVYLRYVVSLQIKVLALSEVIRFEQRTQP